MADKKPFYKTVVGKIVISVASIAVLGGTAFGIYKGVTMHSAEDNTQGNITIDVENPTPEIPDVPQIPETPVGPTTPEIPDVPETPEIPETPEVPETPEITEQEYKQMFLDELPKAIEKDFNKTARLPMSNVELLDFNANTGVSYIKYTRNNATKFNVVKSENLSNLTSCKSLYENLNSATFSYQGHQTRQEDALANEIAQFAFEQETVQNYINENVGTYSNYEVLNATEFHAVSGRMTTDLKIKIENKIFNISMGSSTGYLETQEQYLENLDKFTDFTINFKEIENYASIDEIASSEKQQNSAYFNVDEYVNNQIVNMILSGTNDYGAELN